MLDKRLGYTAGTECVAMGDIDKLKRGDTGEFEGVRGSAGQLFVRFLCLHKNVDMTRTFVRVIGKVSSYIKRALPT